MSRRSARRTKPDDLLLDEFLRMKSAPDVLLTGVFPNVKEITESMGAFECLRTALVEKKRGHLFGDPQIVLYDVGAGRTPRSAVLAAMRTRWRCTAIDPMLKLEGFQDIERVETAKCKIEDFSLPEGDEKNFAVVFCVHSHAKLSVVWEKLRLAERPGYCLISIPCCVDHDLDLEWDEIRDDEGIKSPHRTVYRKLVWPESPETFFRPKPMRRRMNSESTTARK